MDLLFYLSAGRYGRAGPGQYVPAAYPPPLYPQYLPAAYPVQQVASAGQYGDQGAGVVKSRKKDRKRKGKAKPGESWCE